MEALNRLVTDSLVRHGFDRPIDPRRLQWSRWYPCNSPKSLLVVPSKPGIFAIAEEVMDLATTHVETDAFVRQSNVETRTNWEGHDFSRAANEPQTGSALAAEGSRHMLAVLQFSEADDMAFTLDRMFTRPNPMRDRLTSGRCHLRFVTLGDDAQRRSICAALNQWMNSSAEQISVGRTLLSATADATKQPSQTKQPQPIPVADSGVNKNLHCPQPLPSGF